MQARYYASRSARRRSTAVIDLLRRQQHDELTMLGGRRAEDVMHPEGFGQPAQRIVRGHGHRAVVPDNVASPPKPQLTTQSLPTQFATVQPLVGQVT